MTQLTKLPEFNEFNLFSFFFIFSKKYHYTVFCHMRNWRRGALLINCHLTWRFLFTRDWKVMRWIVAAETAEQLEKKHHCISHR